MKMVIQRVSRAEVLVHGEVSGRIGTGLVVLVGLEKGDQLEQVQQAARRLATLRVFEDQAGKMNRGIDEVGGSVLAVSQFTLAGSIRKGRRPSFDHAMPGPEAQPLFDRFVSELEGHGLPVQTGVFGAHMKVDLVNDGPVTLLWDDPPAVIDG